MDGREYTKLIREICEIGTVIDQRRETDDPETRWAIYLLEWSMARRLKRLQTALGLSTSGREG